MSVPSFDYWKNQYQPFWEDANQKEELLEKYLEVVTGREIDPCGLGAETAMFISGSAKMHGYEKGDPDLHVRDTNIYIEVTGPLTDNVPSTAELWIRPDKLNNAYKKRNEHVTFVALYFPKDHQWKVVHCDSEFFKRAKAGEFKSKPRRTRVANENFVIISNNDKCVKDLDYLVEYIMEH